MLVFDVIGNANFGEGDRHELLEHFEEQLRLLSILATKEIASQAW
ncbi:MAG: hypothetical protein ACREVV_14010 [Steroidobacteraceae bacterium]